MKKKYKIEVTKKDIAAGSKGMYCPIDHAAWPVFGSELGDICTQEDRMTIFKEFFHYAEIKLPDIAKKFIQDFDAGKPVKPFTFEVVA